MSPARARPLWIGGGAALVSLGAASWAAARAPAFVGRGSATVEALLDALRAFDLGGALGASLAGPALLLVLAAAATFFLPRTRGDASPDSLPAGVEIGAYGALVALQLGVGLYRLGVHPDMDFDEMSYAAAARMQLGEIPAGSVFGAHPFSKFQAQPLPLWLQAAGVWAFAPGLLATRVVSLALGVAALLAAAFTLRPRLGARSALVMALLCGTAPLWLASVRAGHYIAFSLLHSVLCFAALLRLLERRDLGSAALLGALLGASLYAYQISWFVPGLALLAGVASAWLARARVLVSRAAVVVAVAGATVLPGVLLLEGGLLAVLAQTLDKAVWRAPGEGEAGAWERPVVLLEVPGGAAPPVRGWVERSRARGLDVTALPRDAARGLFHLTGRPAAVAESRDDATDAGARVAFDGTLRPGPLGQAGRMASQLAVGPSLEFAVRVDDAPLLDPWVGPWVLIGALLAWRRRREPVMVALLVWSFVGALLPAALGGTVARRAVLMLPFAFGLAALPLANITRGGRLGRVLVALWIAIAVLDGVHTYFRHWHLDWRAVAAARGDAPAPVLEGQVASGSILELAAAVDAQPDASRILLPRLFRFFPAYWTVVAERPAPVPGARVSERATATSPESVRAISCGETLPVTWLIRDDPSQRAVFAPLAADFEVEETTHGAFRAYHLAARRAGGCTPPR